MKTFAAILMTLTVLAQAEPQISLMTWHAPAGWQTNGISFNVREYQPGQLLSCQFCWTLITNVSTTNVMIVVDTTKFQCITSTNRFTGVEDNMSISPVNAVFSRL